MTKQCRELLACFTMAFNEGLKEALANTTDKHLKDLIERQLLVGYYKIMIATLAEQQGKHTCTCPSGDGSLRWPCPQHPVEQAAPKAAPGELSADSLRHQNKLLAETLGACILASGIVRKDIDGFTGPELLHFGEDLRSMLEAAPKQEPSQDTMYLLRRLLSNQHTLTGSEFREELTKIVGEAYQQETQEPKEIPEAIERMADDRYKVVPSHESMFHRWAVVATGTQQLYLGREAECQNMARKFAGAFLDGAFVAMQQAAPRPAPAPLSEQDEREAVARAIWELMREHEDRCDMELDDLMEDHPVWSYADAALAAHGGK